MKIPIKINEMTEYRCTRCAAWAATAEDLASHKCEKFNKNIKYVQPEREEARSTILQFWAWWEAIGSGIRPEDGEDTECFANRIALEARKFAAPKRYQGES